ncbi:FHA domain-containing protein [Candidatus Binatia bacterium]|nr:FHA domain-containing protein [Candidatus Binatia bacterium]
MDAFFDSVRSSNLKSQTASPFRLVCLRGARAGAEWPLRVDRETVVGRASPDGAVDVDLSPDRRVSRRHALLRFADRRWWLQDLGSRYGTMLGHVRLAGDVPLWCEPGVPVVLGRTTLALFAPHWFRFLACRFAIDVGLSPALNEAVLCAKGAAVNRLYVTNVGDCRTSEARLEIGLGAVGGCEAAIPPLDPGEGRLLPIPPLDIAVGALAVQGTPAWQAVTVGVDGELVRRDDAGLWLLSHDAWSRAPEHRIALAAFVLPHHPLVGQVARAATAGCPAAMPPGDVLAAVYRYLADDWHLDYRGELPGTGMVSQRLRLPDQVLVDVASRQGEGTCVDLAVLMAGCLEYLGVQPLIALVDLGRTWHALVGCWERPGTRLEPLVDDAGRLLRRAIWFDPTGCTRDPSCRATVAGAGEAARRCLREHALVSAIDVAAARGDGVRSVSLRREPPWSAAVAGAMARARALALAAETRLATVPLLIGLLADADGLACRVLGLAGDATAAIESLRAGLPRGSAGAPPSRHYLEVLAGARTQAELDASAVVEESHVLAAMLALRSAALDAAFASLGTDREAARRALYRFAAREASDATDLSVFAPAK